MKFPRLILTGTLCAAALSGCGQSAKPLAGAPSLRTAKPVGRGAIDDSRKKVVKCLQEHSIAVAKRGTSQLVIGSAPQVQASFAPTPGIAQGEVITGHVEGAEVIANALLFPSAAPDKFLKRIEDCMAQTLVG